MEEFGAGAGSRVEAHEKRIVVGELLSVIRVAHGEITNLCHRYLEDQTTANAEGLVTALGQIVDRLTDARQKIKEHHKT